MPQEAITIPNTGRQLYDGDIVMLQRFPEVDWIIHKDWYMYQGTQSYGWYFVSIPDETILPVNDYDLQTCTLVCSSQSHIPGPDDAEFTKDDAKNLNSAFITVESIEARNALDVTKLVNGKLIRVNNVDGEAKYYKYITLTQEWEETTIDDLSKYYILSEGGVPKSDLSDGVQNSLDLADTSLQEYNVLFVDSLPTASEETLNKLYYLNGTGLFKTEYPVSVNNYPINYEGVYNLLTPVVPNSLVIIGKPLAIQYQDDGEGNIVSSQVPNTGGEIDYDTGHMFVQLAPGPTYELSYNVDKYGWVSAIPNVSTLSGDQLGLISRNDYDKIMNFIDNYLNEGDSK